MVTILTERGPQELRAETDRGSDALWMGPVEIERALGWTWKPEGLCRGEVCVPIPATEASAYVRADTLDVARLWRRMGKPLVHTADRDVWLLGEGASDRVRALESLEAPDFTLPDLAGRFHSLSEHRGKKVLLVTWASW